MRDRRDYEYSDNSLSAEEPQFFESAYQDKRAPKGFMGMRGKKASNGFYGVRGKKDLYNLQSDNQYENNDISEPSKTTPFFPKKESNKRISKLYNFIDLNDDEYMTKRVPSGFNGMRGRRGLSGFYGVRGKRDIAELNNDGQNKKRSAITKYIGIRGKKLVRF